MGKNRRVIQSRNQQASTKSIKMSPFLFFMFLIIAASAQRIGTQRVPPQMARMAPVNCDCQCSNYAFEDRNGVQGNCRTFYKGKKWCFVYEKHNECYDRKPTADPSTYPKYWSYEACVTPGRTDSQCIKRTLCADYGICN